MTTDMSQSLQQKLVLPRRADRRRIMVLKGVPLVGRLGLVINDRRSYRERRRGRRSFNPGPPCALLQGREAETRDGKGSFLADIGYWLKRHFKYPWLR